MKKWILRILIILLVLSIIAGAFVLYQGHKMYKEALDQISLEDKIEQVQQDDDYV